MMKTKISTLTAITIVSLTARLSIVLTLTMLCAGAAAANRIEFQNPAPAQQPAASPRSEQGAEAKPEGDWEGTLDAGPAKIRLVLHITRKEGAYGATLDSPDQGALGIPIETVTVNGDSIKMDMKSLRATYAGKLARDGSSIGGDFTQGKTVTLTFTRVASSGAKTSVLELRKIDVGGHSLNLLIGGHGSPAVILEGGFGEGIAAWSLVQKEIANFAQTVSYDRAGLGQSEPGPNPRSAKQIATELHTALQNAGVKPPYVLVGHSIGGPYVRVFADLYPKEVAGIVLVDPSQEAFDDWTKAHLDGKRKEVDAQIAKAPEGLRAEWAGIDDTYSQARAARLPTGIPVILITAGLNENFPAEARTAWIEKHNEWIAKVPGGKHLIADKSGHFIQVQEPITVINAIREIVTGKPATDSRK
jgi:pimeloyl-ACP methyl ester carboxylesterase